MVFPSGELIEADTEDGSRPCSSNLQRSERARKA
jgi:hypothetical protein